MAPLLGTKRLECHVVYEQSNRASYSANSARGMLTQDCNQQPADPTMQSAPVCFYLEASSHRRGPCGLKPYVTISPTCDSLRSTCAARPLVRQFSRSFGLVSWLLRLSFRRSQTPAADSATVSRCNQSMVKSHPHTSHE